jgi:hypothetical protein
LALAPKAKLGNYGVFLSVIILEMPGSGIALHIVAMSSPALTSHMICQGQGHWLCRKSQATAVNSNNVSK